MPSPFPGMDPFLEEPALWPNVHQSLITYARDQLQDEAGERYFVAIGERVYLEEPARTAYRDVHVVEDGEARDQARGPRGLAADRPTVLVLEEVERREPYLELQDATSGGRVIAVIELLSPSNKDPGRDRELYLRKQADVLASQAHLVEVDLLRGGEPTVAVPVRHARDTAYRVVVSRAIDRRRRELYAFGLRDPLPRVAVPLLEGDPDLVLDLPALLALAYQRGAYARRVDYAAPPPPPPLAAEDAAWVAEVVGSVR